MAINKKLIHFKTKETFLKLLCPPNGEGEYNPSSSNILETSICFIKDSQEIWTHGQFYNCKELPENLLTKEEAEQLFQLTYATKEEIKELQPKLTAGTGISIEDNVISCTVDGDSEIPEEIQEKLKNSIKFIPVDDIFTIKSLRGDGNVELGVDEYADTYDISSTDENARVVIINDEETITYLQNKDLLKTNSGGIWDGNVGIYLLYDKIEGDFDNFENTTKPEDENEQIPDTFTYKTILIKHWNDEEKYKPSWSNYYAGEFYKCDADIYVGGNNNNIFLLEENNSEISVDLLNYVTFDDTVNSDKNGLVPKEYCNKMGLPMITSISSPSASENEVTISYLLTVAGYSSSSQEHSQSIKSATTTTAGVMSASDKTKLDNIKDSIYSAESTSAYLEVTHQHKVFFYTLDTYAVGSQSVRILNTGKWVDGLKVELYFTNKRTLEVTLNWYSSSTGTTYVPSDKITAVGFPAGVAPQLTARVEIVYDGTNWIITNCSAASTLVNSGGSNVRGNVIPNTSSYTLGEGTVASHRFNNAYVKQGLFVTNEVLENNTSSSSITITGNKSGGVLLCHNLATSTTASSGIILAGNTGNDSAYIKFRDTSRDDSVWVDASAVLYLTTGTETYDRALRVSGGDFIADDRLLIGHGTYPAFFDTTSKLLVQGNALIKGSTTATSFIKDGGTSSLLLKADGNTEDISNIQKTSISYKLIKNGSNTDPIDLNTSWKDGGISFNRYGTAAWKNAPSGIGWSGGTTAFKDVNGTLGVGLLVWDIAGNTFFRTVTNLDGTTFTDWKQIAYTDSNVSSATKLQNTRTIWGQKFDGTGNVSGDIKDVKQIMFVNRGTGSSNYGGFFHQWNNLLGYCRANASGTYADDLFYMDLNNKNCYFYGNVGIGTTSPSAKLEVKGSFIVLNNDKGINDIHVSGDGVGIGVEGAMLADSLTVGYMSIFKKGIDVTGESVFNDYCDFKQGAGTSSDIRYKTNIVPLNPVLDKVKELEIFDYTWSKEGDPKVDTFGVSALQLESFGDSFAKMVHESEDETKSVEYDHLGVIALKAIQEQLKIIEELRAEVEELKTKLNQK